MPKLLFWIWTTKDAWQKIINLEGVSQSDVGDIVWQEEGISWWAEVEPEFKDKFKQECELLDYVFRDMED